MKSRSTVRKPRNPYVAPALRRKAGAHLRSRGGTRGRSRMAMQRDLRDQSMHAKTEVQEAALCALSRGESS